MWKSVMGAAQIIRDGRINQRTQKDLFGKRLAPMYDFWLQHLRIVDNHQQVFEYIANKSSIILSFEPLLEENFSEYQEKPAGDNQLRKHIVVCNQDNEVIMEFKSGRELANYFQIDGKVARAAIAQGEYQDFLLIYREVSNRKTIYVFDNNSHELIAELKSVINALKYAKVNY